ncbi:MAG: 3-coathanger stack domain-containing protein [Bacteroidota bacterium]
MYVNQFTYFSTPITARLCSQFLAHKTLLWVVLLGLFPTLLPAQHQFNSFLRQKESGPHLGNAYDVAISKDGKNVYAAARNDHALSGADRTSAAFTMTVNPSPTINIPDQNICVDATTVDLTALEPANQQGGSWMTDGQPIVDADNVSVAHQQVFSYQYTDANGCTGIDSVQFSVNSLSVGGSIGGATTVCAGINLSTLVLSGHTGAIIKWQSATDAAFTNPKDIANPYPVYGVKNLMTTTYFRAVVKNCSCAEAYSRVVTMTVDATDENGDNRPDCQEACPENLHLMDIFCSSISGGSYQSIFTLASNGYVEAETDVTFRAGSSITLKNGFTVKAGGSFLAQIGTCENDLDEVETPETAALQLAKSSSSSPLPPLTLNVHPNPISQTAYVHFTLPLAEEVTLHLFDQSGKLIQQILQRRSMSAGAHRLPLTVATRSRGLFYLVLQSAKERVVQKVVVIP